MFGRRLFTALPLNGNLPALAHAVAYRGIFSRAPCVRFRRGLRSVPASESAGGARPDPPRSVGTRALDYFADHPWHFFGPLLGALALWLLRNSRGQANQDALVRALDEQCPLHAREVAQVGAENGLSAAEWEGAWRGIVGAVEGVAVGRAAGCEGGKLPAGDFFACLRVRPSEVEAAVAAATGGRAAIVHAHALRRAAAWLAMQEQGLFSSPASDSEARALLKEREALRRGSSWFGDAPAEAEEARGNGSLLAPLVDAVQALARAVQGGVVGGEGAAGGGGEGGSSLAALHLMPSEGHWDAPLPLPTALALYMCLAGGRGEAEAPNGMLSPSERLGVVVEMQREVGALQARLCHLPPPQVLAEAAFELQQARALAARVALTQAPPPAYSLEELCTAVALLAATFQQPTRARTGILVTLPDFHYGLAPAPQVVAQGIREAYIDLKKTPAAQKAPGTPEESGGFLAGVPKPIPGVLEPLQFERRWLTADEARRALLQSRAVCLWGECTRNKPEYKGALFG